MTSTLSFNAKKPLWSIWKWSLKSNRLAGWLFGVLISLIFPALVLSQGSSASYSLRAAEDVLSLTPKNITDLLPHFIGTSTLLAVFLLIILTFTMFGYLFNKRQVDLFHALPVSRNQMFLGKFLAGLTMTVVPMLVSAVLVLLLQPIAVKTLLFTYSFWSVLPYFLLCILQVIMTFAALCLAAVCCGTLVELILSMAGLLILFPWSLASFGGLLVDFLPGFAVKSLDFWVAAPGWGSILISNYETSKLWIPAVLWLTMTILFLGAGCYCHYKRKSEVAEQGYAFRLPVAFTLFFGQSALGIMVGKIASSMSSYRYSWMLPVCSIAGGLAAALLLELILNRKERKFGKALLNFGVYALVFGCIYGFSITGGLGFAEKTPKLQEIKSVSIEQKRIGYGFGEELITMMMGGYSDGEQKIALETEENRKLALEIQKLAVAERKAADYPYQRPPYDFINSIQLTYQLTNGRTVTRNYKYKSETILNKSFLSTSSTEYKQKSSVIFRTEPESLLFLSGDTSNKGETYIPLSLQQCQTLYTALRTDILASLEPVQHPYDAQRMTGETVSQQIQLGYAMDGLIINRNAVTKEKLENSRNNWSLYHMESMDIPYSYENTMNLLISWGIADGRFSLQNVPASDITAVYTQKIQKMSREELKSSGYSDNLKRDFYRLGDEQLGMNQSMRVIDSLSFYNMYVTQSTASNYDFDRSRDKKIIQGLYQLGDERMDQAAELLKVQKGYIYYFESKDQKGNPIYSRPFYGDINQVKAILNG